MQFRPGMKSGRKSYDERQVERVAMAAMKAREKEMIDEKVQKKKVCARGGSSSSVVCWC